MKKLLLLLGVTAVFFSACTTLQREITIDRQREQMDHDLDQVEQQIVPLEAAWAEIRNLQNELAAARQIISNLENDAAADAYFAARLSAWSGRLALLEGRYSEAVRLHRQSQAAAAGNVPAIILGIRLEGDPAIRLTLIDEELAIAGHFAPGFGELHIEKGRALLELSRFAEAAGAFDAAFTADIDDIYRESYTSFRNRAWEMRNIGDAAAPTVTVLGQDSISWNDCIVMARNETQLLRFISGGRNLSEADFFTRLVERNFIPPTQDINIREWPSARPGRNDMVTRAGAAWFAWQLYAEARADRSMLTRYSERFARGPNPRSPIADIPPQSPFFDAILGCVETELLHLVDGRNFSPELPIRGAELLAILRRIDN